MNNTRIAKELLKIAKELFAAPKRVYEKYFKEEADQIKEWCRKNDFYYSFSIKDTSSGEMPNGYFLLEPLFTDEFMIKKTGHSFMYHLDLIDDEDWDEGRNNDFWGLSNVHVYMHGEKESGQTFKCQRPSEALNPADRNKAETENLIKAIDEGLEWIKKDYDKKKQPYEEEKENFFKAL